MTGSLSPQLSAVIQSLNPVQAQAVEHGMGPMLVLAGPGSGKTRVLTARVARLIQESASERFKVLALTFTNKAASEMLERVRDLNDGEETDRALVGTFHAFCIDVLQSHGAHIGWSAGFTVYGLPADRQAVLREAIERAGVGGHYDERRYLTAIDRLRSRLILPDGSARYFRDASQGAAVSKVYDAYCTALRDAQALDFDGLLFETWRLFLEYPSLADRYRKTYRYWLIDEFQDTNRAQYGLIRQIGGNEFSNIFAVADDDQIIYRWNGASYQQLEAFQRDLTPEIVQLPTNYRCPAQVVEAANALIRHNLERTPTKIPLVYGKPETSPKSTQIELIHAPSDEEERSLVADKIATLQANERSRTVVLARTKSLLGSMKTALEGRGIKAVIAARRDAFVSAGFTWMEAVLRQITRPQDEKNLTLISAAFNHLGGLPQAAEPVVDNSVGSGKSLLGAWVENAQANSDLTELIGLTGRLVERPHEWRQFCRSVVSFWPRYFTDGVPPDFEEDSQAWSEILRDTNLAIGRDASLDEFMHRLDISSKEPAPPTDAVRLMTIHGAKGKEFANVFLIALAEGELPSWQSLRANADADIEEERRNCFVAITRTEEHLYVSYADRYRGYPKPPSRFLREMGLLPAS